MRYAAALDGLKTGAPPPVEKWNPDYCGELNLTIRRDGVWVHEGTPIGRARLVRLFSTVLKREGDRYFLVTPVEKLGIEVEDAPFLAILMRVEGEGATQRLVFTTNVGEEVVAGPEHALTFRAGAPYLHVRRGLEARVARAVFYDLVALCEVREEGGETRGEDGEAAFGVFSDGVFFPFGSAASVFDG